MRPRLLLIASLALTLIASGMPASGAQAKRHHRHQHHHRRHHHKRKRHHRPGLARGCATTGLNGWAPLTSARAAQLVPASSWEPRPANNAANHTVPSPSQIQDWRAQSDMPYADQVDGRYGGTTDQIIQWAACKWGVNPDVMRAVATVESWWKQDTVGDNGDSFGIFQVRRPYHCFGDCAIARDSTAFNADYYGGIIRAYFNGEEDWLNDPDVAPQNGSTYAAGDLWGSVGAWFDGRWHTGADSAYVAEVQQRLAERTWTQPDFLGP